MSVFSEAFLTSLSDWQRGWEEDQQRKSEFEFALKRESAKLPSRYREPTNVCYRKYFLNEGELVDILVKDIKVEGSASWTTDLEYAKFFKGKVRPGTITGAIFEHLPDDGEVVLDLVSLWRDEVFVEAVEKFCELCPGKAKPLLHFKGKQKEVVLSVPLRGSQIVDLSGVSSSFDELCDQGLIPNSVRDAMYMRLIQEGKEVAVPVYVGRERAQKILNRVKEKFESLQPNN